MEETRDKLWHGFIRGWFVAFVGVALWTFLPTEPLGVFSIVVYAIIGFVVNWVTEEMFEDGRDHPLTLIAFGIGSTFFVVGDIPYEMWFVIFTMVVGTYEYVKTVGV